MKLCNADHGEVCYEDRDCPACGLVDQIHDLGEKIGELRDEIEDLKIIAKGE